MYTQCPQCLTYFQVTPEHLKIAQGNVRCGQCRNVFSAIGNLTELPAEAVSDITSGDSIHFEENMSASLDTFENDLDDETPTPQSATPRKARTRSGLNAAISAMNKLNKLNKGGLQSLADGRKAIIERLRNESKSLKKSPSAPAQTKVQAKVQPKAQAQATVQATAQARKAQAEKLLPASAKPVARATARQTTPNTPVNSTNRSASPKPRIPEKANAKLASKPATNTKISAPGNTRKTATPAALQARQKDSAMKPSHKDIDVDEALLAIDELDISQDPATSGGFRIGHNNITKDIEEIILSADVNGRFAHSEPAADIKIKRLDRTQSKRPSVVPRQDSTGMALQIIPKPLLEDFQQARQAAMSSRLPRKFNIWIAGSVILMIVFLGQTIHFKHNDLARISSLRPWIESFCRQTNCKVALPYEGKKLELLGQDIRSHPKIKKALLVSVTIINNASYAQAYPGLQITFTDMNNQKIAMRRFVPKDYLKSGTNIEKGMLSDTPVQVELQLMDPGSKAVNFEFEFFNAS